MAAMFDYAIVGGGTAGLVLANRLSEDPDCRVVVLEAGQNRNDDPNVQIPAFAGKMYDDARYDWCFRSTPQAALGGRSLALTRGKLLGGSSAINIMAAIYPHRSTIDAWESELSNPGWNFGALQPYYKKAISTQVPSAEAREYVNSNADSKLHGLDGPLQTSYPPTLGPIDKAWQEVFQQQEAQMHSDMRSGDVFGGFMCVATVDRKTGTRSHAGNAYYEPVADRPNLELISEAMVTNIAISSQSEKQPEAISVDFIDKDGLQQHVEAAREVILYAGSFQSPQLLELSGIGDPDILKRHGIVPIVENPFVGENLQDHPMSGASFEVMDGIPTTDMNRDPTIAEAAFQQYQQTHTGPLAGAVQSAAYSAAKDFHNDAGRRELDEMLSSGFENATEAARRHPNLKAQYSVLRASLEQPREPSCFYGIVPCQMHFDGTERQETFGLTDPHNFITIVAALTSPYSRGSTHISSPDPSANPVIDPAYLSHPLDRELLARHMKYLHSIAATEPMSSKLKSGGARIPADMDLGDLQIAREFLTRNVISNNHAAGTCAMLPRDSGGVVDSKLRVHGVGRLRVVDASVFPLIPKGNIQTTVYAVAERAADIIKSDQITSVIGE